MGVSRQEFLRIAATASAGWLAAPSSTAWLGAEQTPASDSLARVSRVIEAFDRQGIHRTGTDTDDRSAAWLLDEARQAGAEAALESFNLNRVDLRACFLQAGDRKIEGLPLFDGTFTSERGIVGRLGSPESDSEIALVELDGAGISSEGRAIAELRRSGRHQAIVAVTRGAHAGLSPMNAPAFAQPFGLPVLQVGSDEAAPLQEYARRRTQIQFIAHAERTPDTASNVVGTVRGRRPELPPLVVMTPRSGWWNCAGERGGGIACWLEAIRAIARAGAPRTALFVASSGHELGHFGLDSFISRRRDLVKGAVAWIHLGANIGAAGGRPRLQASDDAIEEMAAGALTRAGTGVQQRVARGTVPAGEARNIHLEGGRYTSLLGSSPFFHNAADRWPAAVDAPAVARFAAAIADLGVALARES
jgi:hypothetical protein